MVPPDGGDIGNLPVESDVRKAEKSGQIAQPLLHRPLTVEIDVDCTAAPAVAGENVEEDVLPLLHRPHPPDAGETEPTVTGCRPGERPGGVHEGGVADHLGPVNLLSELLLGDPSVVFRDEVDPSGAAVGVDVNPPQAVVGPVGFRRLLADNHIGHQRRPTDVGKVDRADAVVGAPLRHHSEVSAATTQFQRQPEVAGMKGQAREARQEPVDRIGDRLLEPADPEAAEADTYPS